MKTVLDLTAPKAYQYFMEPKNYCSQDLPEYINFKPVLDFIEKTVGEATYDDILKDKKKKAFDFEGVNHTLLIKKDAKYTFRPIQISNPYLYYLLVRIITSKTNWSLIKKRFKQFARPQIEVSSIPAIKGKKDKSHRSAGVSGWWEKMEQRSIALGLQYKYMFVTDITNCYPSIYTHTIGWALLGKKEAGENRYNQKLYANQIDSHIRWMQAGQSNGIPQGSTLYDFIAEMVLGFADMELADRLEKEGIEDYKLLRYRDDYKFFSNNKEEIDKIAFILQEVLTGLNFQLNAKKTLLTVDVVQMSIKSDKLAYATELPLYKKYKKRITTIASSFQQEALYIHQFASRFPNSGTLSKMLTLFSERVTHSKKKWKAEEVEVMVAILTEIALESPKAYGLILHLISFMILQLKTTEERERIVKAVYNKFTGIPNIGEVQLWMQHITYKMPHPMDYDEPLCKIVANDPNVVLWNNDWVKEKYKKDFPQDKICTDKERDSITPLIDIDEVSLFKEYE